MYLSVLINYVYPAVLTACGVMGNNYILGRRLEDMNNKFDERFKKIEGKIETEIEDVGRMINLVLRRQAEHEVRLDNMIEKLRKECGKNRQEVEPRRRVTDD